MHRLPGEYGPVLLCSGELSAPTKEALIAEAGVLELLGHPVAILDLTDCAIRDAAAADALLQVARQLKGAGSQLVIVAGTGRAARVLPLVGIAQQVPTFPTHEAVDAALRGRRPRSPGPASWQEARAQSLARWQAVQQLLASGAPRAALRALTSAGGLCRRAEERRQEAGSALVERCRYCPLYEALGGDEAAVGCRRVIAPIIDALSVGGEGSARARVAEVIRTLEAMPVPAEAGR
jgi:anti-anti-sigma regulatory factor